MDKLYCKLDELDKLRMSSMSWISCTVSWMSWKVEDEFDELAKLYCKFDELAKLRMSSMSWISCTVSWMSWLSWNVSLMSWIS